MTAQELYNKCFAQVWPTLEDLCNDKEVELVFSADTGYEAEVETSIETFTSVLSSILNSALTQTLRGTEVRVSVGSAKKQLVLSVRDHGPGMSKDQISKLYNLDPILKMGAQCEYLSREFVEFPDNHGTQIIITL